MPTARLYAGPEDGRLIEVSDLRPEIHIPAPDEPSFAPSPCEPSYRRAVYERAADGPARGVEAYVFTGIR